MCFRRARILATIVLATSVAVSVVRAAENRGHTGRAGPTLAPAPGPPMPDMAAPSGPDPGSAPALSPSEADAAKLLQRAKGLFDKCDYRGALAELDKVIEGLSVNTENLSLRAKTRYELGDRDGAETDLTHAIVLTSDPWWLGECFGRRGLVRYEKGNLNEALADCTAALLFNPRLDSLYSLRGRVWEKGGKHEAAVADFTKAIKLNPRSASAFSARAEALGKMGKWEESIADWSRSLKLDPNSPEATLQRGLARLRLGEEDKARRDFDACLRLKPDLQARLEKEVDAVRLSSTAQRKPTVEEEHRGVNRR
jgi:tetratricopeptide (TPR) repeat protein